MSPVHAPELETTLGWLNTDRPLRFADELRGQVVVLDFWTYCCINCIHILPDLKFLEEKYHDQPVCFIGVHSAKFSNEASRETIRAAILRYEIAHPVVIDEDMHLWRGYAARSWPTVVVVGGEGHVVSVAAGEGNRDVIDHAIAQALASGKAGATLANAPLELTREANVPAVSGLKFPGKILADAATDRLYVADSNHNRIIVATLPDDRGTCEVLQIVGNGAPGAEDGSAESATFDHPQGLVVGQGNLYVADTENHLIRSVNLHTYEVTTAVGTGEMSNDRAGGLMGVQQGLNSPWDLAIEGSTLYVAMAGTHQIWRIDMPVGFARAFAGSGRENLVDGPTETAALAQPSGICTLAGRLYFADSEVSAIRGVDMNLEQVFTVLGEGLFTFGDVDGVHPAAKLQHPLGVDAWGASLVVADTYNHKIKLVDPAARSVRTLFGSGKPGTADGDAPAFFEPGGLSVVGDDLFVADTNNHRVVKISLDTGAWREVIFEGLRTPQTDDAGFADCVRCDPVQVRAGEDVEVELSVDLPDGAHISPDAPWSVKVVADGKTLAQRTGHSATLPIGLCVPGSAVSLPASWKIQASLAYCTSGDQAVCIPATVHLEVPITPGGDASRVALSARIEA